MKKMKSILALLLAVTLALSLTACGSPAPGTDMSDPAPSGALSDREEGSVIFSIDWPAYIDPGVGNKAADMVAHLNLYDTLTFPLSDGTVAPLLAESWEANHEATEYTFHLMEHAKFHSGNPVTAKDVKFSMDRLLTMGEGYAYLFSNVASTEVVDEHTVKFTLKEPSGGGCCDGAFERQRRIWRAWRLWQSMAHHQRRRFRAIHCAGDAYGGLFDHDTGRGLLERLGGESQRS